MSNKLTYIEARDKIWNAYFRDEIRAMDTKFCFCGTLCGGDRKWYNNNVAYNDTNHFDHSGYTGRQLKEMERPLMRMWHSKENKHYEDDLFSAMIKSLEVLKQIHRDRGDFIPEDEPLLTKRNLEHA